MSNKYMFRKKENLAGLCRRFPLRWPPLLPRVMIAANSLRRLPSRLPALVLCWAIRTNDRKARVGPVLGCQPAPSPLAAGLASHLEAALAEGFAAASTDSADAVVASVLQQLVALTPPSEKVNAWVHKRGELITRALRKDSELARALADGSVSLTDAIERIDARLEASGALFDAISGHHARLSDLVTEDGRAPAEWQSAVSDAESLQAYAAAAAEIGTRGWARACVVPRWRGLLPYHDPRRR